MESTLAPEKESAVETALLQRALSGPPSELWNEYRQLRSRVRAGTLSGSEHPRLIELTDQIEALQVERLTAAAGLAKMLGCTLLEVMDALGIFPVPEE